MTEIQNNNPTIYQPVATPSFWTGRHVILNLVMLVLASLAAYLQYYLYPLVMALPSSFGETNISLKFSFLTFQYTATKCTGGTCTSLTGIPAFDFFQAMIIVLVFVNILHFFSTRKK